MVRIAVFDSGLGSLSIIKEMQKKFKAEIIYFADNQNFPYGTKTLNQIKNIMKNSINLLGKFEPDYIVVASNTPSLMLNLKSDKIFSSSLIIFCTDFFPDKNFPDSTISTKFDALIL